MGNLEERHQKFHNVWKGKKKAIWTLSSSLHNVASQEISTLGNSWVIWLSFCIVCLDALYCLLLAILWKTIEVTFLGYKSFKILLAGLVHDNVKPVVEFKEWFERESKV